MTQAAGLVPWRRPSRCRARCRQSPRPPPPAVQRARDHAEIGADEAVGGAVGRRASQTAAPSAKRTSSPVRPPCARNPARAVAASPRPAMITTLRRNGRPRAPTPGRPLPDRGPTADRRARSLTAFIVGPSVGIRRVPSGHNWVRRYRLAKESPVSTYVWIGLRARQGARRRRSSRQSPATRTRRRSVGARLRRHDVT